MPTPTTSELLAFESRHPNPPPDKQLAIEAELGVTAARYYQLLGRVVDDPAAAELEPMLVHRLRRLRRLRDRADARRRAERRTA
ncbi:hypothetical protein QE428_002578 [Microbacterium sp. SORGH_AS 505]|uniref:DUF3263 domain-containing protein n=1 Tax=Microbacterium sp. SORGH_AS_0505 TaxID=3041770 RepID=UPI00277EDE0C|nr:DUF3263 domain-containing protein [Microbacterium sp. SORGH_AS_0505]MDQ1127545.1 hypothetical protein [Microbacterium sp. SORGH_AS_0505]